MEGIVRHGVDHRLRTSHRPWIGQGCARSVLASAALILGDPDSVKSLDVCFSIPAPLTAQYYCGQRVGIEKAKAITSTTEAGERRLAYAASYPDNKLVFTASDMILHIESDG